ncbi:myeloid cell surface antigen CD33-like [Sebastes umbrosus]|uniref:myeloid cell surface antigen CD33-like n=1 Tax=Sebastes umbrosus TaxID=72105 RepID=UPI00189F501B|nr:myeloid cell surface antigen CD33-like [Sebastes umbrosus]
MNNIYPMSLTGDLSQNNCTTLFSSVITNYTGWYYFRIENGPFVATTPCNRLQITVKDTPPRPSIEISGDLKENQSVTITCSAITPCPHSPPELTWTLQQDPHNKIEENPDGTFTTKIPKTFTKSDEHDGFNITCSARYPVNEGKDNKTAEKRMKLSVSYAHNDTSVSISSVSSLQWGSAFGGILVIILICLVICVWWFKSKRPQTQTQRGDELTLQMPASKTEEDIHYGEIDFSKRRPEPSSALEQDGGQQQDTLYAQVNVSETASSLRQAADVPEDLYAQVKKK